MKREPVLHDRGIDHYYKTRHTTGAPMLLYVHKGQGSLVTEEHRFPLEKGALYWIGADVFHFTLPENPAEYERTKLLCTREEFQHILTLSPESATRLLPSSAHFARLSPEDQERAEAVIAELAQHQLPGRNWLLASAFLQLLALLEKSLTAGAVAEPSPLQGAVQFIHEHFREPITLEGIAEAIPMSKFHFCRKFKEAMGMTVMDYVLKTRLGAAKHLLEENTLSISRVCERCGFSSLSYFSRVFKKDSGMTPMEYRKRKGKKP